MVMNFPLLADFGNNNLISEQERERERGEELEETANSVLCKASNL